MTWTLPRTWSVGELTTAALMNEQLRDNLDWLKTRPAPTGDTGTSVVLSTTSYADIITLPSTIFTAAPLLIGFTGAGAFSAAIGAGRLDLDVTIDGTSVGGTNGVLAVSSIGAGFLVNCSFCLYVPAVSAAAHIIKLRGKVSAGSCTIQGTTGNYIGRLFALEIG